MYFQKVSYKHNKKNNKQKKINNYFKNYLIMKSAGLLNIILKGIFKL